MKHQISKLRKQLKQLSGTTKAALAFLIIGLIVVLYGFFFTQDEHNFRIFVEQVYSNLGIELISVGLTVLVIESLNRRAVAQERKKELILQKGSPDNSFAIEATRTLRQRGWL